jgi:hypothetical protein
MDGLVIKQGRSSVDVSPKLVELVYELLDAHEDTARIADEHHDEERWAANVDEDCWAAHLDYLRQLQRVGRELLAEAST